VTAPLSHREFVEWFRDQHTMDGIRIKFIMADDAEIVNLDQMTDEQAQKVAEQIVLASSGAIEGRA